MNPDAASFMTPLPSDRCRFQAASMRNVNVRNKIPMCFLCRGTLFLCQLLHRLFQNRYMTCFICHSALHLCQKLHK